MSNDIKFDQSNPIFELELDLSEIGNEGSGFRIQNDPSAPLQRKNITERRGAIDVRCTGVDVIHGYLKDGEDLATLIVHEFQFDPRKKARRIATVDIEYIFGSDAGKEPEVLNISPKGRMTLVPTARTETITKSGEFSAGGKIFGAEVGSNWKWEKATSRETSSSTTIVGSIDLKGRNYGASNAVSWTLLENESTKTGVPAHFRTAVLLSRQDSEEFYLTFKIRTQVDLVSQFARLFGSIPIDDPIRYDPILPPTNKLREYNVASLGEIDLQELDIVSFTNHEL
ncbi:uncharacterized protein F4807DRAFT_311133 [Annulohypoxylon truncatum]|uniref:uncharacterized protein n=1 Tax=Annulohypoxylon truncatum TaxID=327061 RepID=UPI002008023D|nr:uncharacterized protein F4807DRAFT_311133 [Annulohypoxylon truncatum]KAI1213090.1 hypothetical protein F4807DRAFT_311133 [Annulohypoxylon truncatum]